MQVNAYSQIYSKIEISYPCLTNKNDNLKFYSQNEELASLPVGTEVSAKYKGAFCEAKVKKVNRIVVCKVSFKQVQVNC